MLFNIHCQNDLKWPLKKMTRLYTVLKNYKWSGNEIKNLKILNSNEYKRQQLIKYQLFTATFLLLMQLFQQGIRDGPALEGFISFW